MPRHSSPSTSDEESDPEPVDIFAGATGTRILSEIQTPKWRSDCSPKKQAARKLRSASTVKIDGRRVVVTPQSVLLHVYDLDEGVKVANGALVFAMDSVTIGGAFHAGVEVFGNEWTYGRNGVQDEVPRASEGHVYRCSVVMGRTSLSLQEVAEVLRDMCRIWLGGDYDLLSRNCCSFCAEFVDRLGVGPLPPWVNRFARILDSGRKAGLGVLEAGQQVGRLLSNGIQDLLKSPRRTASADRTPGGRRPAAKRSASSRRRNRSAEGIDDRKPCVDWTPTVRPVALEETPYLAGESVEYDKGGDWITVQIVGFQASSGLYDLDCRTGVDPKRIRRLRGTPCADSRSKTVRRPALPRAPTHEEASAQRTWSRDPCFRRIPGSSADGSRSPCSKAPVKLACAGDASPKRAFSNDPVQLRSPSGSMPPRLVCSPRHLKVTSSSNTGPALVQRAMSLESVVQGERQHSQHDSRGPPDGLSGPDQLLKLGNSGITPEPSRSHETSAAQPWAPSPRTPSVGEQAPVANIDITIVPFGADFHRHASLDGAPQHGAGIAQRDGVVGAQGQQSSADKAALEGTPRDSECTKHPFPVGACVEYLSASQGMWLRASVLAFNEASGRYDLDCKQWAEPHRIRWPLAGGVAPDVAATASRSSGVSCRNHDSAPAQRRTFPIGAAVEYHSASHGAWLQAKVLAFHAASGCYDLDCKQLAEPQRIRWPAAGSAQGGQPRWSVGSADIQDTVSEAAGGGGTTSTGTAAPPDARCIFPVGAAVEYHSASQGIWLQARVLAFHAATGRYDLDCKQQAEPQRIRAPLAGGIVKPPSP